ncbi:MAG TPA: RsmB/NOP family class I SAM-dependent RNA methyltransferase [Candidatus Angelobacter sp.]|nr:RsmB/NOP family class I SAM-dependent RNA methyltransferase [Candidatus Angelobacter sp.]
MPDRETKIEPSLRRIAAEVIQKSDRDHPADAILRETFKRLRVLSPAETRRITEAVFTYFRWRGFLNLNDQISAQIEQALESDAQFQKDSASLSDELLRAKTVPKWTMEEVNAGPEWFRILQTAPNLWLRAKRGQGSVLAEKLVPTTPGPLPDAVLYQGEEDLFRTPEFHAGEFELQDISSQAVSLICDPQPGETWWDACAGQGGKLLHLSDLMENKGLIWASDRAEWRLKQLKRRAGRAKAFNYRAALWNGGPKLPTKTKFDGVLVDAPCSGIGTWQRNPHARWTTTREDVKELGAVQKRLLANVAASIKPGGKLIYAVCTLAKSETVEVVESFEKQFPDFQPLAVKNPLNPKNPNAATSPQIWIWPHESGGNGMFVAVWKRTS